MDALLEVEENKKKWKEELRSLTKTYDLAVPVSRKKTRRNAIAKSKGNHKFLGLKVTLRLLSGQVLKETDVACTS